MLLPEAMANTENPNEHNTNYVFATQSKLSRISLADALLSWPIQSGAVLCVPGHGSTHVRRRQPARHAHIIRSVHSRHPTLTVRAYVALMQILSSWHVWAAEIAVLWVGLLSKTAHLEALYV